MDWYEGEVRELERRIAFTRLPASGIAFYGSSSIRLWDTLATDLPNIPTLNAGFGGSTLAACVHFYKRIIVPVQPRRLVIYAGDNDLGDGRSPDEVMASFHGLRKQIEEQSPSPQWIVLSIKPSPSRWPLQEKILRTNLALREAVKSSPQASFVDIYPHMLDEKGLPRRGLFLADGLHLNPLGYKLWAEHLRNEFVRREFLRCDNV